MLKSIYLVGKKLTHSISPELHGEIGLYDYDLAELAADEVEGFFRAKKFDGLNVTIPYKKIACGYMDVLSDTAKRTGAVNTVINDNGVLYGYNSDYFGFRYLLEKEKIDVEKKKVLVLGTGGAAATVSCVCKDMGAKSVEEVTHEQIAQSVGGEYDILINCTPVGMYPYTFCKPAEISAFKGLTAVIDLVYNPFKSELLLDAEDKGIKVANGLSMLVAQAVKSAEMFSGKKLNNDVIEGLYNKMKYQNLNIAIIGMGGCGKSAVAAELNKLSGKVLIDTDVEVKKTIGLSPEAIILRDGEDAFRKYEKQAVAEAAKKRGVIVATGGGVVLDDANVRQLRQTSVIVYMYCPPEKLELSGRPLYPDVSTALSVFDKRRPLYEKYADFIVINDHTRSAAEVAKEIYDEITGY